MGFPITRRDFLASTSAAVLASGLILPPGCAPEKKNSTVLHWENLPPLEGSLSLDEQDRRTLSTDIGRNLVKMPAAVLRPRTITDVVKMVEYANKHRISVAMRGIGHSQYGQTLAENGIVIDSTSLNSLKLIDNYVHVQPGASWNDVVTGTLIQNLTPPAMGDSMALTVGGILSAGGISNSSHLYGSVADSAEELDVVTGTGDLITCSNHSNSDLFEVALAGMGQCGLIVGARVRLIAAPRVVVRCTFNYQEIEPLLLDYQRLAKAGHYEHLGAYVLPREAHEDWKLRISIGKFCQTPDEFKPGELMDELNASSHDEPVATDYYQYLHRERQRDERNRARWADTPTNLLFTCFFVPESVSVEFVKRILSTPEETDKMLRFSMYALSNEKFISPMLMLPKEPNTLCIFLFHEVPVSDPQRYAQMTNTVKNLAAKVVAASGKMYPPYAPFYVRSDWERHYESEQWKKIERAKNKYDPNRILTPGMSI